MKLETQNALLQSCLDQGIVQIGEIQFTQDFKIFHKKDLGVEGLQVYEGVDAARDIVRYDAAGKYRPLKTAPNLRRGWELRLTSLAELRIALDFFYPAALGLWLAFLRRNLQGTPLRETLDRQSGMYRMAAKMTDAEAEDLSHHFCQSGCLRQIGWKISGVAETLLELESPEIPLICSEACHLFVAEARRVVKKRGIS